MELTVTERPDGVSHVTLQGRLDPYGSQKVRERFRAATVALNRPAVVDMREVTFITSVGIGMLVDCADTLQRNGLTFVLVSASGHVDDVLRKTGVYNIIPKAPTFEEALGLTRRPRS